MKIGTVTRSVKIFSIMTIFFMLTACGGETTTLEGDNIVLGENNKTIDEQNIAPIATSKSIEVDESSTNNLIILSGTDVNGDSLTYHVVSEPTHGILSGRAPHLIYTPTTSYLGMDSFTFTINDGTVNSLEATVKLIVNAVTSVEPTTPVIEPITPLVEATVPWEHGNLKVSSDGHMLQHEDGEGFFWMADTAWFIFLKMSREDVDLYLTDRADKGFTVIQTNIMSEAWIENFYGDKPFKIEWPEACASLENEAFEECYSKDENKPFFINELITKDDEYDYWDHVEYVIDKAAEKGIYIALTLTWDSPVKRFIKKDKTIYTEYASFLAERYKDKPNIFWINGGDIYHQEISDSEVWDWIGETIKAKDSNHLMSWHGPSSGNYHHNKDWLDFNMIESGHGTDLATQNEFLNIGYNMNPSKPVVDAETRYEEITIGLNTDASAIRISPFEVREIAYYQVFAGAFGHTYGHNSIWQVISQKEIDDNSAWSTALHTWEEALDAAGAKQMGYLAKLMQSRPIVGRVPDQSLIANGEGIATRGDGYGFIYSTSGKSIDINMGKVSGTHVNIWSYNPETGEAKSLESFMSNSGTYTFVPEGEEVYGNDWVLVIDDASKEYGKAGERHF